MQPIILTAAMVVIAIALVWPYVREFIGNTPGIDPSPPSASDSRLPGVMPDPASGGSLVPRRVTPEPAVVNAPIPWTAAEWVEVQERYAAKYRGRTWWLTDFDTLLRNAADGDQRQETLGYGHSSKVSDYVDNEFTRRGLAPELKSLRRSIYYSSSSILHFNKRTRNTRRADEAFAEFGAEKERYAILMNAKIALSKKIRASGRFKDGSGQTPVSAGEAYREYLNRKAAGKVK